jgi:aminocarboxymuconate-semialdehyde decarboxylase
MDEPTDTSASNLYRCSSTEPTPCGSVVSRLPYRTIDVHCHLLAPPVERLIAGHPSKQQEAAAAVIEMGLVSFEENKSNFVQLLPRLTNVERRIADMNAMGVDVQALSPSPSQFYYWAEPDLSEQIVALQNDAIAAACASHPERFVALGTVSLQTPRRAAEQLRTLIRDRGFKGAQISTLVNGKDIADRYFDSFWATASELGAVVLVHPWGTTLGSRLDQHYLMNTIGQPLEHTICLSKLIFGGTFDRHPELKLLAAHGGGYLPAYAKRSDHAYAVRTESRGCACKPSEYLRRIWFDSVVYDTGSLRHLASVVGSDRVVIGTDYPFDMGHYDPSGLVAALEPSLQRMILGDNAARLFGLPSTGEFIA